MGRPRKPAPARRWLLTTAGMLTLAACSSPIRQTEPIQLPLAEQWQGRFALSYLDTAGQKRSTTATFELTGSPDQGSLRLSTPLGTQLADIRWRPNEAVLQHAQQTNSFASLEDLLVQTLGTPFPVKALFHWLQGRPTPELPEWEADLSELVQGKLSAYHAGPAAATLRLLLTR